MTNRTTYQTRLLNSLKNGCDFTAGQIASRFNMSTASAYDLVFRLRSKGHNIQLKEIVTDSGNLMNVYALPKRNQRRFA